MVLSMTGYGRGNDVLHGRDITVEIKSVNSRYFEYSSRMPRNCVQFDDKLKKLLNAAVSRGKAELALTIQNVDGADTTVNVNMDVARAYREAMQTLAESFSLTDDTTVSTLSRFNDIFTVTKEQQDDEMLWADIESVAKKAIDAFITMRAAEGAKLKEDILSRLVFLSDATAKVEETSAQRVAKYIEKLSLRLTELLQSTEIDEGRILTEAALFADKTAVDEETVRLKSHIAQYKDILSLREPVGRKLDFLTQELNREVNTIGSKVQDLSVTHLVVDMKAEIEKIREQVQNIE
ncbi:MAG: YicC/YloC family endoribonuclease [Oscillospiraceae bacterium]